MIPLTPGDYNLPTAEGTLRFSVAGTGPACIALAGGPGMDARYFEDLGGITDVVTLISLHPAAPLGRRFPL